MTLGSMHQASSVQYCIMACTASVFAAESCFTASGVAGRAFSWAFESEELVDTERPQKLKFLVYSVSARQHSSCCMWDQKCPSYACVLVTAALAAWGVLHMHRVYCCGR